MENRKTLREVCELLQVSRRVIQGYEKAGLVSASQKNKYGHLLYDNDALQRISQIRQYQNFGYSIKEIQKIIDAPDDIRKEMLKKQLVKLKAEHGQMENMIQLMQNMIDELEQQ